MEIRTVGLGKGVAIWRGSRRSVNEAFGLRICALPASLLWCLHVSPTRRSTSRCFGELLLQIMQLRVGLLAVVRMDLSLERVQSFRQLLDVAWTMSAKCLPLTT